MADLSIWMTAAGAALVEVVNFLAGLATVAVAAWGYGNWRLYRLELDREDARRSRFAGRIAYLERQCGAHRHALERAVQNDPGFTGLVRDGLEVIRDELPQLRAELEAMVRESPVLPARVLAHLDAARVMVFSGSITLGAALRADDGTPERRGRTQRFLAQLAGLESATRAAYESIPEADRRMEGGEDYQLELDEAFHALPEA